MRWSLRNDDDDGSENGKRAIGLDKQNNVARASRFFVHFSAVAARLLRARGGGYCHIWAIWVCAAVKGMVFKQFTLG